MTLGERRTELSRWWPSARALLIAIAIAAGLIDGAPIPTPRVMTHLPPALQTVSLGLYAVQHFLLAPLQPIKWAFGINQRWALFSSTGPLRHRMWVEARRDGEPWSLVYRPQDAEPTFLQDTLEYRRVRNVWNPNRRGTKPTYPAFTSWIARQIFLERPDVDEAKVSMERVTILEHGEGFEPTGEFEQVIVHRRQELLP